MLLVGVLWVLPMLAFALLFSEGDVLEETGCRFDLEQGHPKNEGRCWLEPDHNNEKKKIMKNSYTSYQENWQQLTSCQVQLGTLSLIQWDHVKSRLIRLGHLTNWNTISKEKKYGEQQWTSTLMAKDKNFTNITINKYLWEDKNNQSLFFIGSRSIL